jgi:UDP-glucose 4-epimerase
MLTVLVLGAGQVGTFAARAIAEAGAHVIAADLHPAGRYFARFGPKDAQLTIVDILDSLAVGELIRASGADTVVLSAGLTGEASARDPRRAWQVNVAGASAVASAALDAGVRRLIFISSFAVYGRPALDRIDETVLPQPRSEYGRTKAAAEHSLSPFRDRGLDVRILRPCGIYGPPRPSGGSHSARFVESMLLSAATRHHITIEASQASADEYLYVKDLGRAIAFAARCDTDSPESVFNVGSGRKATAQDLSSALQRIVPDLQVTINTPPDADPGRPLAPLDVSRIRTVFGFEPRYALAEGLADYVREMGRGS